MAHGNIYKPRYAIANLAKSKVWPYKNSYLRRFFDIRARRRKRGGLFRRCILVATTRKWTISRRFIRPFTRRSGLRLTSGGGNTAYGRPRKRRYRDNLYTKQQLRHFHGKLKEEAFRNFFRAHRTTVVGRSTAFSTALESRLDRSLFRRRFLPTIFASHQFIHYYGIEVNGKIEHSPHSLIRVGDRVSVPSKVWKPFFWDIFCRVYYRRWGLYISRRRKYTRLKKKLFKSRGEIRQNHFRFFFKKPRIRISRRYKLRANLKKAGLRVFNQRKAGVIPSPIDLQAKAIKAIRASISVKNGKVSKTGKSVISNNAVLLKKRRKSLQIKKSSLSGFRSNHRSRIGHIRSLLARFRLRGEVSPVYAGLRRTKARLYPVFYPRRFPRSKWACRKSMVSIRRRNSLLATVSQINSEGLSPRSGFRSIKQVISDESETGPVVDHSFAQRYPITKKSRGQWLNYVHQRLIQDPYEPVIAESSVDSNGLIYSSDLLFKKKLQKFQSIIYARRLSASLLPTIHRKYKPEEIRNPLLDLLEISDDESKKDDAQKENDKMRKASIGYHRSYWRSVRGRFLRRQRKHVIRKRKIIRLKPVHRYFPSHIQRDLRTLRAVRVENPNPETIYHGFRGSIAKVYSFYRSRGF